MLIVADQRSVQIVGLVLVGQVLFECALYDFPGTVLGLFKAGYSST